MEGSSPRVRMAMLYVVITTQFFPFPIAYTLPLLLSRQPTTLIPTHRIRKYAPSYHNASDTGITLRKLFLRLYRHFTRMFRASAANDGRIRLDRARILLAGTVHVDGKSLFFSASSALGQAWYLDY